MGCGFAVLETSKLIMYRLHYGVILGQLYPQANLLLCDTDSLCYSIDTYDLYKDLTGKHKDVFQKMFDTSNFDIDHIAYSNTNNKALGKLKFQEGTNYILEIYACRPKMYSVLRCCSDSEYKKFKLKRLKRKNKQHVMVDIVAKGLKKYNLKHEMFRQAVLNSQSSKLIDNRSIISRNLIIYTNSVKKKRYCCV